MAADWGTFMRAPCPNEAGSQQPPLPRPAQTCSLFHHLHSPRPPSTSHSLLACLPGSLNCQGSRQRSGAALAMDATTGAVHYHKLQLWEPGMESEEEEEEEEIAEPLVLSLRRIQNTPR